MSIPSIEKTTRGKHRPGRTVDARPRYAVLIEDLPKTLSVGAIKFLRNAEQQTEFFTIRPIQDGIIILFRRPSMNVIKKVRTHYYQLRSNRLTGKKPQIRYADTEHSTCWWTTEIEHNQRVIRRLRVTLEGIPIATGQGQDAMREGKKRGRKPIPEDETMKRARMDERDSRPLTDEDDEVTAVGSDNDTINKGKDGDMGNWIKGWEADEEWEECRTNEGDDLMNDYEEMGWTTAKQVTERQEGDLTIDEYLAYSVKQELARDPERVRAVLAEGGRRNRVNQQELREGQQQGQEQEPEMDWEEAYRQLSRRIWYPRNRKTPRGARGRTIDEQYELGQEAAALSPFLCSFTSQDWPNISTVGDTTDQHKTCLDYSDVVLTRPHTIQFTQDLYEEAIGFFEDYIEGRLEWYSPFMWSGEETETFAGEAHEWVKMHTKEIVVANRRLKDVQSIADQFSKELGIKRMHASHFFYRINLNKRNPYVKFGTEMAVYETNNELYDIVAATILRLIDAGQNRPEMVHPDLSWSINHIRAKEWVNILAHLVTEKLDVVISPKALRAACYPKVDKLLEGLSTRHHRAWDRWRVRYHNMAVGELRTAGGCMGRGRYLTQDLRATDMADQDEINDNDLNHEEYHSPWHEIPTFGTGPATGTPTDMKVHKIDQDPAEPVERKIFQTNEHSRMNHIIKIRGEPDRNAEFAIDIENIVVQMTPPTRRPPPFPYFQHVRPFRCAYRFIRNGQVEVEFEFIDGAHAYCAWSRIHRWVRQIPIRNPICVPNQETYGEKHPLSALCTTIHNNRIKARRVVGMAGWRRLQATAYNALTIYHKEDKYKIKLRYRNPIEAQTMIGAGYPWQSKQSAPYYKTKMTTNLRPHHAAGLPSRCRICGRFGHDHTACLEEGLLQSQEECCVTCWAAGLPQNHDLEEECSLRMGYMENSRHFVNTILAHHEELSILGRRYNQHLRQLLASCGPTSLDPPKKS